MIKPQKTILTTLVFLFGLCFSCLAFSAAEKVHMDRMLTGSTLVLQGTIVSQRVDQGNNNQVNTILTLNITDIIKGSWEQDTIDISFLGGSLNGLTLQVGGQHIPELGQEGVFFIENPLRKQVNPLYGWEQGLFVVETDPSSGEKVVQTASKQAITDIKFLPTPASQTLNISTGVASGVQIQQASELKTPYTLNQFKSALRSRLEGAK